MKIKESIRYLSELPEDEEIDIAHNIEKWIDWFGGHEQIAWMLEEARKGR